jgi:hypothetical protein
MVGDRATTLRGGRGARPADSGDELFRVAAQLFDAVHGRKRVVCSESTPHTSARPRPSSASSTRRPPPSPVDKVRDELRRRFGEEAITRTSLLGRRERRNPSDKPPR